MLDAADAIFARDHFRGASIDEIAERSGITKPLIYRYFGSKEGLYEACVQRQSERAFAAIDAAVRAAPAGPERIEVFVREYVGYLADNRDTWWLLYADAPNEATNRMRERNAAVVANLLADTLAEQGRRLDPISIDLLARTLAGAGEEMGRWWGSNPEIGKDELAERFLVIAGGAVAAVFAAAT